MNHNDETSLLTIVQQNYDALDEIYCNVDNINHLELMLYNKIIDRKEQLEKIQREYDSIIHMYSNIVMNLLNE